MFLENRLGIKKCDKFVHLFCPNTARNHEPYHSNHAIPHDNCVTFISRFVAVNIWLFVIEKYQYSNFYLFIFVFKIWLSYWSY